jgi:hypothetical protein
MNDIFQQISHKLYLPKFHYQDFSVLKDTINDLVFEQETAKKIIQCSLPILSSIGPVGEIISLSTSSFYLIHQIELLGTSLEEMHSYQKFSFQLARTINAIVQLVSTIFDFKLGLAYGTAITVCSSFYEVIYFVYRGQNQQALEHLNTLITSSLYLAILTTGSIEISLVCVIFQGVVLFIEATQQYRDGNNIESLSSLIQMGMKIYQATNQYELLQKQKLYYRLERMQNLIEKLERVREISHFNSSHPLIDLENNVIDRQVVLNLDNETNFGSHFPLLGGEFLKGMNLEFIQQQKTGGYKVDFNLTLQKVDPILNALHEVERLNPSEVLDLFEIFSLDIHSFRVEKFACDFEQAYEEFSSIRKKHAPEEFMELFFGGLGSIRFYVDDRYWYMRSHVQVFLEEGKNLYDLHTVLCLFGLDPVLRQSTSIEIERMKIGHLFRVFYPEVAHRFEETVEYLTLSIDALKEKIIQLVPDMQRVIDRYLDKMSFYEIIPGKFRFQIHGLKEDLKEQGAYGLTCAVFTSNVDRLLSILDHGLLSSELRLSHGVIFSGLSNEADRFTGGSDSVYTQLVTDKNHSYSDFVYQGPEFRILIDLKAVETGTYQYLFDSFGMRRRNLWSEYYSSIGLETMVTHPNISRYRSNEVMVKDRVLPEWILGLVVRTENMKHQVLQSMRIKGMIEIDHLGKERINGILVDEFFQVTTQIDERHFFKD